MENNNNKKRFISSKSLKYGSNSIILIVGVIILVVLANVLIGMTNLKLDLTTNKLYSLSDVSTNLLKDLKQDVTITGLFDDGSIGTTGEYKDVTDLLSHYQKYGHIKVSYVDPDKNPGIIKQLDESGTMNLQKGDFVVHSIVNGKVKSKMLNYSNLFTTTTDQQTGQQTTTGSDAEQGFSGAIKYVVSEKTPVVYFTEGHNEIAVNSDYTNVKNFLDENNFTVKTVNLITAGKVPDDAAMLLIAAPKSDLSKTEETALTTYLRAGGNAVFLFDYLQNDANLDNFNDLLSGYNLAADYDKIKETDANNYPPGDAYNILYNVSSNAIIPQTFPVLLGNSRSISTLKNQKDYVTLTPLVTSASTAFGEMISKSRGTDLKGPLDVAVAAENKGFEKISKILVFGNASFIADSAAQSSGYSNSLVFFMQSISWMIDKKDEIILPTKNYDTKTLAITQVQANVVGGVLVVVLPLIILGLGLLVYLRRRHL
jgi:ABC-2 type transport system permease protein